MKNSIIHLVSTILPLMGMYALFACQAVNFPEEEYPEVSEHKLTVLTRSTNQELSYPIRVYGFSESGVCLDAQTIQSEAESLSLKLPAGQHKVVALSGSIGKELPVKPSLNDVITLPECNYLTEAFSMGQADVAMGEKSQTVTLLMTHRVASLNLTLKNVPEEVSEVNITLSNTFSQLSLAGDEKIPQMVQIPCKQQDAEWTTDVVYLLPSESETVNLTISLTYGEEVKSYGYLHNGALEKNTPYTITGTYAEGVTLNGDFAMDEWEDTVNKDFTFGPGAMMEETPTPPTQPADETATTDNIPEAGTLWERHFVVHTEDTDTGADILLISLKEWDKLTSALNEKTPDMAAELAQTYVEDGMKGWRIPTEEEAKLLSSIFYAESQSLNAALESEGGQAVGLKNEKNATIRYLCEEGTKTFSFASLRKPIDAGKTVTTYRLRLVKSIQLTVK